MTKGPLSNEEVEILFANSERTIKEAIKEKEQRENNPPECPETCEFKVALLEIPDIEFNKPKRDDDFFISEEDKEMIGNKEEADSYLSQEMCATKIEEKRRTIIGHEDKIKRLKKELKDEEDYLSILYNDTRKLLPVGEEFLKKLLDGSSKEE